MSTPHANVPGAVAPTGHAGSRPAGPGGWLLRAAMTVPAAFFMVIMILDQVTPRYDPVSQFASNLSLGRLGPIMIANFLVLGCCEVGFGIRLWSLLGPRPAGRLTAAFVTLAGLAFLIAGIFVTDPQGAVHHTMHGVLHVVAALLLFPLAFPGAGFAAARRFRRERSGFARYSLMNAVASPVLFVITFMSGGHIGLMERILIAADLLWLTVLAVQAARLQREPTATT